MVDEISEQFFFVDFVTPVYHVFFFIVELPAEVKLITTTKKLVHSFEKFFKFVKKKKQILIMPSNKKKNQIIYFIFC